MSATVTRLGPCRASRDRKSSCKGRPAEVVFLARRVLDRLAALAVVCGIDEEAEHETLKFELLPVGATRDDARNRLLDSLEAASPAFQRAVMAEVLKRRPPADSPQLIG